MKITIHGAGGGEVTGSAYLVQTQSANVLVDCGLFQGQKKLENYNGLPRQGAINNLNAVILTHAHLDHFVLASDAFVVTPGGIGTVLEAMMVWQLLQVRHLHDTPLIFVGRMWAELVDWASRHMLSSQPPLANAGDIIIPRCLNTADEAIAVIREHQVKWISSNLEIQIPNSKNQTNHRVL